jgi:hypothetical protein
MAKIEIYFGNPNSEKEWGWVEKFCDSLNIGVEASIFKNFSISFENFAALDEHGKTYFELIIGSINGDRVKLPKMTAGTYKHNGFVLPKLVIHGDHALDIDTNKPIFISDKFIEEIGKDCELDFSYDYYGFKRVGKVSLKTNEVTYLIKDKEHIFHSGNFLEVKK